MGFSNEFLYGAASGILSGVGLLLLAYSVLSLWRRPAAAKAPGEEALRRAAAFPEVEEAPELEMVAEDDTPTPEESGMATKRLDSEEIRAFSLAALAHHGDTPPASPPAIRSVGPRRVSPRRPAPSPTRHTPAERAPKNEEEDDFHFGTGGL
jgi:hypothetical protein